MRVLSTSILTASSVVAFPQLHSSNDNNGFAFRDDALALDMLDAFDLNNNMFNRPVAREDLTNSRSPEAIAEPEANAEPNAQAEPQAEPERSGLGALDRINTNDREELRSGDWYEKYETIQGNYRASDHIVSVAKNITEDHFNRLVDIIEERNRQAAMRSFDDFVKMAFWQVVLSETDNGHLFNDIHEISLQESTSWWKSNFVNHGCYCWPEQEKKLQNSTNPNRLIDSQKISGFGQPRDPIDETCFDLYNCYRCVSLMPECKNVDWVTSHYDCQFVTTEKINGTNNTRLALNCNDPDPCMQSLCECDKDFSMNAKSALQFKDPENSKVFPEKCPRAGHEDSKKKCCGAWPKVRPFPTDEKCCSGSELFNLSDGVCSIEEINHKPTFEDLYSDSTITLNMLNPAIMNHNHNSSHVNSDHIHPVQI